MEDENQKGMYEETKKRWMKDRNIKRKYKRNMYSKRLELNRKNIFKQIQKKKEM